MDLSVHRRFSTDTMEIDEKTLIHFSRLKSLETILK